MRISMSALLIIRFLREMRFTLHFIRKYLCLSKDPPHVGWSMRAMPKIYRIQIK